jgi:predicted DNA-binding protein (UPF0251 family)/predicted Fe-Mo cluster-binding NifX family protein
MHIKEVVMRHRKKRFARRLDQRRSYKPIGVPTHDLNTTSIALDEFEAMRLCDVEGFSQIDAAHNMKVSRATIQRLLTSGRSKLMHAILNHHAFIINNATENIQLRGENNMGVESNEIRVIAIPTSDRKTVDVHFGHTKEFALFTVKNNTVIDVNYVTPPTHQPGVYPRYLAKEGVHLIITGGMGQRAITLFKQNNIDVILGANGDLECNIKEYLGGALESTGNGCDH